MSHSVMNRWFALRSQSPFGELLCYGVGLQMLLGLLSMVTSFCGLKR